MRLLVVRACAIGDFVLHLPALRALAARHSQARFTLVGYPATLSLARTFLPVEEIYSIESPPWAKLFAGPAPALEFDAAWVWMKDPTLAENLRRSGVRDVFLADPFPSSRSHAAEHLLETLGISAPELPDLWDPTINNVLLHPGSGSRSKNWPHFEELARSLPEAEILLGPCEKPLDVRNRCHSDLSLCEVADVLRRCRLFIGNDSGITHIAAYWGAPTVALFGSTDPKIWGPLGRRVKVLHKPALEDISLSDLRNLL